MSHTLTSMWSPSEGSDPKVRNVGRWFNPSARARRWVRRRFEETKQRAASRIHIELDEEDRIILEDTKELCRQLGISPVRYNPYRVEWVEGFSKSKSGPVHVLGAELCNFDPSLITLQKSLKGRLDPKDWKPLIASKLILDYKLMGEVTRHVLFRVLLPISAMFLVVGIALGYLLYLLLDPWPQVWLPLYMFAVFLSALITVLALAGPHVERAITQADRESAALVGKRELLDSLRKIESMGLEHLKGGNRLRRLFHKVLEERINSLLAD